MLGMKLGCGLFVSGRREQGWIFGDAKSASLIGFDLFVGVNK